MYVFVEPQRGRPVMKCTFLMLIFALAAGAAEYDTATLLEVRPEGTFFTEAFLPGRVLTDPIIEQDGELIWQFSIASGFTQKVSPLGDAGGYVFTGGWYGGGKMFLGTGGSGTVLWETEPQLGTSLYWKNLATGTAAAYSADYFYLVRSFDVWNDNGTPGSTGDDFLVSEDNVEVCLFEGSSSTPVWVWDGSGAFIAASPDEPGKYDCTGDGEYFAVGGYINGHLGLAVFVPDSANPCLLFDDATFAYSPRQLRITDDGSKVIFSVGADLLRLDVASGVLEDTYSLGASTDCFDISGDGSLVAYGFTSVRLAQWDTTQYNLLWSYPVSGYYAGAAAVAGNGDYVYYGLYKNTYLTNRILLFDPATSTPIMVYDTPAGSGSNQDLVSWMDCSQDGRYLAASCWGCQTGGGDEVIVLDRESSVNPVFSINTPGSMWHVDISPDGTYLSAAGKHVHANQMGSGADVYMADLTIQGIETDPAAPCIQMFINPNPCSGSASIGFSLPEPGRADLSIFDLTGRRVRQLENSQLNRGDHSYSVSSDLPGGLYLVSLAFNGERVTEMLLINR
jgi:hypothetical protein